MDVKLTMQISNLARLTAEDPNEALLAELRTLEKKMGLVLTLVCHFSTPGALINVVGADLFSSSKHQYGV